MYVFEYHNQPGRIDYRSRVYEFEDAIKRSYYKSLWAHVLLIEL